MSEETAAAAAPKNIDDLKEMAVFLCELGNAIDQSAADGKMSISDALYFVKAALSAPKAFIGISNIKEEYLDLNDAEKVELNKLIADTLELAEDKIEGVVESVLKVAFELNGAINLIIAKKAAS